MRIRPIFAWYDLWVGAYWDRAKRRLYILPFPCVGFVLDFAPRKLSGAEFLDLVRRDGSITSETCKRMLKELCEVRGHDPGQEDGICSRCGQRIVPR